MLGPRPKSQKDGEVTRRKFLRDAAIASTAGVFAGAVPGCITPPNPIRRAPGASRRVVLVRFGGGVRYQDTFGDPSESQTPFLRALAQEGTLFTNVWNENLTLHDTGTLYQLTGSYGTRFPSLDDRLRNVEELRQKPLLFERYREQREVPIYRALAAGMPHQSSASTDSETSHRAMTFADEEGGEGRSISGDPSLGNSPHVRLGNERLGRLLRDISTVNIPLEVNAAIDLVRQTALAELKENPPDSEELIGAIATALTQRLVRRRPYILPEEADEWLINLTIPAMEELRPDLVGIALSTPDLAHTGAWRSYTSAVRGCDMQLLRLRRFLDTHPYYRDQTTLIIAPDCGRGDPRFDDHREPFDSDSHRHVFLLAYGPKTPRGLVVSRRSQLTDIAPTVGHLLDFDVPGADGSPLTEMLL